MFEKEKIEIEIDGHNVEIHELDYLQDAQLEIHIQRLLKNEEKINDVIIESITEEVNDKGEAIIERTVTDPVAVRNINLENRQIVTDAYNELDVYLDGTKVDDTGMFLKKIGHVRAVGLLFEVLALGKVKQDDLGK